VRALARWAGLLGHTLVALPKMPLPRAHQPTALVLANAPTLEAHLRAFAHLLPQAELYVVNSFPQSEKWQELKPQNYVLLDDRYWRYPDDADNLATLNALVAKTNWPLRIYVPFYFRGSRLHRDFLARVPQASILWFNYVWIDGFAAFRHWAWRKRLAMPRTRQVVQACIWLSINRRHREVYLLGLENDLHRNLYVDETNQLYQYYTTFHADEHNHVADLSGPVKHIYQWKADTLKVEGQTVTRWKVPFTLLHELDVICQIHRGYHQLAQFARAVGVPVYNASRTSQVEAFPRRFAPPGGDASAAADGH
jgi:hypothetical protein